MDGKNVRGKEVGNVFAALTLLLNRVLLMRGFAAMSPTHHPSAHFSASPRVF